jgi:hypothetical protein
MRLLRPTLMLLLLVHTSAAWADPLVIYGPGSPSSDLASQALKEVEVAYGVTTGVDRLVHVNEVPFPAAVPLWVMGDAEVIPCRGAAITGDELRELLAKAQASEGAMEWDSADDLLDDATAALSCSGELIDSDLLWRLFYTHGAIAYFDGRTGEARDHFRKALSIDPTRRHDPNFPPQIQAAYLDAREEQQLAQAASLRFLGGREGTTEIWLDGGPLPVAPGTVAELQPGYHLLQYRTRLDVFYSVAFKVKASGDAILVSGSGYSWAILAGDSDERAKVIATQALTSIPGVGADLVYIVAMEEGANVYRFDPARGYFDRPVAVAADDTGTEDGEGDTGGEGEGEGDEGDTEGEGEGGEGDTEGEGGDGDDGDTSADPGDAGAATEPPPTRSLGIAIGGGPLIAFKSGTGVWAGPSLGFVGKVYKGLHVDGGFHLGLRSTDTGINMLPLGHVGLRMAFTPTVVRPYVSGLFAFGTGDEGVKPGGLGAFGVMIEPGATRRFRLTVEVAGGYVGAGMLVVNVGIGPLF